MLNDRNNPPIIEVSSVSFAYDTQNTGRALNRVSFFINTGERVAILGHNGSGKSTLSKIMGGIIDPTEGSVIINGTDIKEIEFRELRKTIGLVFQDPENQIVAAMVEDDVAFAPENQGLPSEEIQLRVEMALSASDMMHKKDAAVEALSGGEKQRLALAGILAADVKCLILDEPTAMLDPRGRVKVEKVLRYLHAEGMTIIQVTHQLEAESFSDIQRVIVLSKGEIIWEGNTESFWDNAEDLGFTVPDSLKVKRYCDAKGIEFPDGLIKLRPIVKAQVSHGSTSHEKFLIDGLGFKYDDKSYALKDIHANIYAGEWLSIIGRTGSGKST
ncbi:MAG: ATP-binding cassette domain-containing protein, partial [Synergistaceae bacterium]|nr:ATP-binding cassette domain-containing protein [Synergistaceae bacterium]